MGGRGVPVLAPSEFYRAWFREALSHAPQIRALLRQAGAELPLTGPVAVEAHFYRENAVKGDLCGYLQALGDWLQEPRFKPKRNGAGIIRDDAQIESWDGSRRHIDRTAPRIEIVIQVLPGAQKTLAF